MSIFAGQPIDIYVLKDPKVAKALIDKFPDIDKKTWIDLQIYWAPVVSKLVHMEYKRDPDSPNLMWGRICKFECKHTTTCTSIVKMRLLYLRAKHGNIEDPSIFKPIPKIDEKKQHDLMWAHTVNKYEESTSFHCSIFALLCGCRRRHKIEYFDELATMSRESAEKMMGPALASRIRNYEITFATELVEAKNRIRHQCDKRNGAIERSNNENRTKFMTTVSTNQQVGKRILASIADLLKILYYTEKPAAATIINSFMISSPNRGFIDHWFNQIFNESRACEFIPYFKYLLERNEMTPSLESAINEFVRRDIPISDYILQKIEDGIIEIPLHPLYRSSRSAAHAIIIERAWNKHSSSALKNIPPESSDQAHIRVFGRLNMSEPPPRTCTFNARVAIEWDAVCNSRYPSLLKLVEMEYKRDPMSPHIRWDLIERHKTIGLINFGQPALGNLAWMLLYAKTKEEKKRNKMAVKLRANYNNTSSCVTSENKQYCWREICKYVEFADIIERELNRCPLNIMRHQDLINKYHNDGPILKAICSMPCSIERQRRVAHVADVG